MKLGESQLLTFSEAAKLIDGDLNDTFPLLMYYKEHSAYIYIEPIEGIYVLEIENQSYSSKVLSEMESILLTWLTDLKEYQPRYTSLLEGHLDQYRKFIGQKYNRVVNGVVVEFTVTKYTGRILHAKSEDNRDDGLTIKEAFHYFTDLNTADL